MYISTCSRGIWKGSRFAMFVTAHIEIGNDEIRLKTACLSVFAANESSEMCFGRGRVVRVRFAPHAPKITA